MTTSAAGCVALLPSTEEGWRLLQQESCKDIYSSEKEVSLTRCSTNNGPCDKDHDDDDEGMRRDEDFQFGGI